MFESIMIWKRASEESLIRFTCLRNVNTGKCAVHSADFFKVPVDASQFAYFDKQFLELLSEESPEVRCKWFDSVSAAIEQHELDFAWSQ